MKRTVIKKLPCFQIISAKSIMPRDPAWTALQAVYDEPRVGQFRKLPDAIEIPKKRRGEKIRVTFTNIDYKDF